MVNLSRVLYYLYFAKRRLYWDREKLESYQLKRLRSVIRYADEHVPFYHKCFKESGFDINSIRKLEDISKLPVIKKEKFKKQDQKNIVSSLYEPSNLKKVRTSGSTGTPFEILINSQEDAWRKAIYMRANMSCGQKPRDKWVVLTSPTHIGDTTNIQRKIGIFAQNCISLFESTDQKIKQVELGKPDVLDGYSGSLVMLAKEIKKKGLKTINPHLIFGNAEFIDPQSRHYLEDVFGAPYCDQFGCAEMDRTAWQCLEREGYHMDVDSVITEFIDSKGEQVSPGERGEVTYTSLFNYSMPFIRYSIGDIGVPSDETCSCGRKLPLMKIIEGRKDSFLIFPDNRIISPMIFNYAISQFKHYKEIEQFQITQKKIDHFQVYLKLYHPKTQNNTMISELDKHLKQALNIENTVEFNISFIDEIPLSKTGKLRSVWSEIRPESGLNY